MADENDQIDQAATPKTEDHKHHTWLETVVENIQKLDTEFPLSGGETEEDFERVGDKEDDEENKEVHHPKTSFYDDLETEFPLSGGEVER